MRVDRVILNERKTIENLLKNLDRRVDFENNIDCVIVDVTDTGTADVEFTVDHNLGRVPSVYFWNISKSGFVYDSNRTGWTTTQMTLKCSAANATLKLVIS